MTHMIDTAAGFLKAYHEKKWVASVVGAAVVILASALLWAHLDATERLTLLQGDMEITGASSMMGFPGLNKGSNRLNTAGVIKKLLCLEKDQRFLWYAPHSGYGNQLVAFRNAMRMAGILNRTLIIPPILHHTEIGLGDCSRGRANSPDRMRLHYWKVLLSKLNSGIFVSMADTIDVSRVSPGVVRTIDVRLFLAIRCGLNVSQSLSACSWCTSLLEEIESIRKSYYEEKGIKNEKEAMQICSQLLGITPFPKNIQNNFFVQKDCTKYIYMHARNSNTGELISTFDAEEVKNGTCVEGKLTHSNRDAVVRSLQVRKKNRVKDVIPLNVEKEFGMKGSKEEQAEVLLFGTAFYYFDFSVPTGDSRVDKITCATEFMSLSAPIMNAASKYAKERFKQSFACLHFRGGDMFFIAMQEDTMQVAKKELKRLHQQTHLEKESQVPLFLMSDLTNNSWHDRFDAEFSPLGYTVRFPEKLESLHNEIKLAIRRLGLGIITNRLVDDEIIHLTASPSIEAPRIDLDQYFINLGVLLEQAICSCADAGFVGTKISSVSRSIKHLINGGACSRF